MTPHKTRLGETVLMIGEAVLMMGLNRYCNQVLYGRLSINYPFHPFLSGALIKLREYFHRDQLCLFNFICSLCVCVGGGGGGGGATI